MAEFGCSRHAVTVNLLERSHSSEQELSHSGDQLLVNKKHKELLETYEARVESASGFARTVHPGLQVTSGPLLDPKASSKALYL